MKCRFCGHAPAHKVMDFGVTALANAFLTAESLSRREEPK